MVKYVKANGHSEYRVNTYFDDKCRDLSDFVECDGYDEAVEVAHELIGEGKGSVEIVNNRTGASKCFTYDEYFDGFEGESPFTYVSNVLASTDTVVDGDFKRKIMRNKKVLVDSFNETFSKGPRACAELLVDRLGIDDAKEIVAVMTVAHGDWDARIDDRVKSWAKTVAPATKDEYRTENICYCDAIHPAHFNAIADYIMKA